ncbi:MAG: hypothetical protein EKK44_07460 [Methylobacterium sp.]|nr:MAG: hypothetical protein EKK44_07460 [Methylobacterium sp.]
MGASYEVERSVSGKPPYERLLQRQARSQPLAAAPKAWVESILPQLSGGSDLTNAFPYMLVRLTALTWVFDNGRIALDNNRPSGRCGPSRSGARTIGSPAWSGALSPWPPPKR